MLKLRVISTLLFIAIILSGVQNVFQSVESQHPISTTTITRYVTQWITEFNTTTVVKIIAPTTVTFTRTTTYTLTETQHTTARITYEKTKVLTIVTETHKTNTIYTIRKLTRTVTMTLTKTETVTKHIATTRTEIIIRPLLARAWPVVFTAKDNPFYIEVYNPKLDSPLSFRIRLEVPAGWSVDDEEWDFDDEKSITVPPRGKAIIRFTVKPYRQEWCFIFVIPWRCDKPGAFGGEMSIVFMSPRDVDDVKFKVAAVYPYLANMQKVLTSFDKYLGQLDKTLEKFYVSFTPISTDPIKEIVDSVQEGFEKFGWWILVDLGVDATLIQTLHEYLGTISNILSEIQLIKVTLGRLNEATCGGKHKDEARDSINRLRKYFIPALKKSLESFNFGSIEEDLRDFGLEVFHLSVSLGRMRSRIETAIYPTIGEIEIPCMMDTENARDAIKYLEKNQEIINTVTNIAFAQLSILEEMRELSSKTIEIPKP